MMDIKKTISSTTVHGSKDSAGRDFRTQLNVALYEVCSQAGFDVQKDADNTNVTATLPWGTVLSINDIPTSPSVGTFEDQVILVWSEQLKVAYVAFLNSLVNGLPPNAYLSSFGLLWVVGDKKQGIPGPASSFQTTLSNMAMRDTVGSGVPNILVPLYFSYDATGTLKGLALPFYCSMSLGRTPAGTIVTDGVTDFYSCGNCIYIREGEDHE